MENSPRRRRPRPRRRNPIVNILIAAIVILSVADISVISLCLRSGKEKPAREPGSSLAQTNSREESTIPQATEPLPPAPESTATILSTGDLLMHKKVINTGKQEDGSYNFDSIFQYIRSYVQQADYAVANLETTLCGTDKGYAYSGNPLFNCPDAIVDSAKASGFDLLLTANNHCADTGLVGYRRTLEVVRSKGVQTLGTYLSADEQKWVIVPVNGIQIGMMCYTYSEGFEKSGNPTLNYHEGPESGMLNYFHYNDLPTFYSKIQTSLEQMRDAGAEATILYIHWGEEYKTSPNSDQTSMAQKLCDLGVDVIIGGHPHVLQPLDLLQSTQNPDHQTLVLYSLGNAVSNQRKEELANTMPTGETEDGCLYSVTFAKYPDGGVYVDSVTLIPTWVNMHANNGTTQYPILPLELDKMDSWQASFGLTDSQLLQARSSYNRTQQIVGQSLQSIQSALLEQKQARESIPAVAEPAA